MIYAIYKYGLRMEAIGFLDMYMFWHLQFSVSGFAIFGDSLYHTKLLIQSPILQIGLIWSQPGFETVFFHNSSNTTKAS
jgi:hypothetical protein